MDAALDGGQTTVSLPTSLYHRIEERIKGTGFASVSSYVAYVLREVLADEDTEGQGLTPEDEEQVKQRLRALGYLE